MHGWQPSSAYLYPTSLVRESPMTSVVDTQRTVFWLGERKMQNLDYRFQGVQSTCCNVFGDRQNSAFMRSHEVCKRANIIRSIK